MYYLTIYYVLSNYLLCYNDPATPQDHSKKCRGIRTQDHLPLHLFNTFILVFGVLDHIAKHKLPLLSLRPQRSKAANKTSNKQKHK